MTRCGPSFCFATVLASSEFCFGFVFPQTSDVFRVQSGGHSGRPTPFFVLGHNETCSDGWQADWTAVQVERYDTHETYASAKVAKYGSTPPLPIAQARQTTRRSDMNTKPCLRATRNNKNGMYMIGRRCCGT